MVKMSDSCPSNLKIRFFSEIFDLTQVFFLQKISLYVYTLFRNNTIHLAMDAVARFLAIADADTPDKDLVSFSRLLLSHNYILCVPPTTFDHPNPSISSLLKLEQSARACDESKDLRFLDRFGTCLNVQI
ncbi:hypothetical protein RF11_11273 [Thelohanellus kitauei]|uniref:Uncharacterized protein n=1 Tax=Thelohanellus kitauei TaxID=669202 RepID=A0A0C2I7K3_THEKT|nr:hypothetical protein RF11_11273 [Thelohanellus kitauei]